MIDPVQTMTHSQHDENTIIRSSKIDLLRPKPKIQPSTTEFTQNFTGPREADDA